MELAYKNEKCNIDMFNIALKPQSNWVSLSCGDGRTIRGISRSSAEYSNALIISA